MNTQFDNIRDKMFRLRFENELDEKLQNELNVASNDRLIKLSSILKVKQIKDTPKISDLDIYLQEINKMAYFVKWRRLSDFHKNIKLKEYINNLIDNKKQQNNLLKQLEDLDSKKLNKIINYDDKNGIILDISGITYDDKLKLYKLNA